MKVLERVILVNINAEVGEGIGLQDAYEVRSYPTFILVDSQGAALNRWTGYFSRLKFVWKLNSALKNSKDP